MKTIVFSFVSSGALALAAQAQSGGPFDLSWSTIDGGGGPSAGGGFSLNGTIGQPDAGAMSGGNFSLAGGFWGAIPTPPPAGSVIIKVWVVGGQVRLRFTGIPGRIYYVERAHSVTGPWPDRLASITMPINGVVEFVDTTAFFSAQSFYRTRTD
jgi:hypothetical protein